jgi:hypothetical protein
MPTLPLVRGCQLLIDAIDWLLWESSVSLSFNQPSFLPSGFRNRGCVLACAVLLAAAACGGRADRRAMRYAGLCAGLGLGRPTLAVSILFCFWNRQPLPQTISYKGVKFASIALGLKSQALSRSVHSDLPALFQIQNKRT